MALPSVAVSQPDPDVYVIGAVNPDRVPPPPFVIVICWFDGIDPPLDALNEADEPERLIAGGTGAEDTV